MPHSPTDEQQAIIQATSHAADSLMIRAYAGCSKTTTLEMAAPSIKQPALALAFNRKIAQELQPRLPPNFTTKTLNGWGHQAWARAIGHRLQLDDRKLGKLVTATAKDFHIRLPAWQWDAIRTVVSKAMAAGLVPSSIGEGLLPDTLENWYDLDDLSPQDDRELTQEIAHSVLCTSISLARQGHISFDDQIYCPTLLGAAFPQFPIIFGDEVQDWSPLNVEMVRRSCGPNTRLALVGDQLQSIYLFRGAGENSMEDARSITQQWEDYALTLTFRCPKAIVSRQQHHAPGFTAFQANQEGDILSYPLPPEGRGGEGHDHQEETAGWKWSDISSYAGCMNASRIAVLCRNNAPLMALAFKLLRRGIGCQVLGRDIGRSLITLSKRLCPTDEMTSRECVVAITDWQERESSLARANERPAKAESINDRAESLIAVLQGTSASCAGDLRTMLDKLFSRDSDPIILSTIHKAKGLEWPLVIHLDPWRVPSRQAKAAGGSALQQEHNLIYVCETRTQHTLIHANLKEFI